MRHHPEAGDHRRPEGTCMADNAEWIVPKTPTRDADGGPSASGLSLPVSQHAARMAQLRRQVADGMYASESMMDTVARRILRSGDL